MRCFVKYLHFPIVALAAMLTVPAVHAQQIAYSVKCIWNNGSYCAFTSLVKYKGRYYCSFREGESHIFDSRGNAEGKVRIIVSDDGETWESAALLEKEGYDLRDPKLSITPDERLMVTIGGSVYRNQKIENRIPQVSFSDDGKNFSAPQPVILPSDGSNGKLDWVWRVTWHEGKGYGVNVSYNTEGGGRIFLLETTDGIRYSTIAPLNISGYPNETTVRFLPDGRMAALVRQEQGDALGYWGVAEPPFTNWTWKRLEFRLGGPNFLVLDNGLIVAGSRNHYIPSSPKTSVFVGNADGVFQEALLLPSGGDTSYTGLLVVGDELWVSYYSSHETKNAAIYLAKIPMKLLVK